MMLAPHSARPRDATRRMLQSEGLQLQEQLGAAEGARSVVDTR